MNKVLACIDGLSNSPTVIDWAAWSARRLNVPLTLVHALGRPLGAAEAADYSGAIGLGAQEALLHELSELDERRNALAQEAGRQMLAAAQQRAAGAGVAQVDTCLRHGELLDTVLELEPEARLFVLGQHQRPAARAPSRLHLDHQVERVIRSVKRPVLVAAAAAFAVPERAVIAFDGSATARAMVETVACSPLLVGLPLLLAMAGEPHPQARQQLEDARAFLAQAGFLAESECVPGEPEQALPALARAQGRVLLVMGAYGHSRIRQWVVGSTTTTLLRLSELPVLVLR